MSVATPWRGRHLAARVDDGWEYVVRPGASGVVAIVAVTDARELVLVEQPRRPVGTTVVEIPAGLVGDGDDGVDEAPLDAARRELLEETGYEADRWTLLLDGPSSAGLTDERPWIYVAQGLRRVGDGGGDASETITVHVVPLAEVATYLRTRRAAGALVDPKVLTALWVAGVPWDGDGLTPVGAPVVRSRTPL